MSLSGIELRYLKNEISNKTRDYYVSNIYGITKNSLLFKLHHPEKPDVMLMLSTSGMWLSSVKIEQIENNRIQKRLRSDLLRLKLNKIEQIGSERVVYLKFSGFDKEFILVGEFFADGNIILCNNELKILALLHSIDVRHRKLHVGLTYTPPPQKGLNIFEISRMDLDELKNSNLPAANWVGRTVGLPKKFVEEVFHNSKVNPKAKGNTLQDDEIQKIFNSLKKLLDDIVNGHHSPIIIKNDSSLEVSPIKLDGVKNITPIDSFMEALDSVFSQIIVNAGKNILSSNIEKKINDLESRLEEQLKAINQVKEKFGISNVTTIFGNAKEKISELPQADAIFIGGTGGDTKEILELCSDNLKSGGRIVVGVILIETLYLVLESIKKLNLSSVDITQITISKSRKTSTGTMMLARNPVTIISATKN